VVAATDARVDELAAHPFSDPSILREFEDGVGRWQRATALMADARTKDLDYQTLIRLGGRVFPLLEGAVVDWNDAHGLAMQHLTDRLADAEAQRADTNRLSIALTLLVIAVALAVCLRLTRTVVKPTQDLRAATARIAAGDHEPVTPQGPAELAELAHDFNTMAERLRQREEALVHRALHDPLTGFGNRTMLSDRLGQALRRRTRHGGEVAVLVLDLDGFKNLNDSLGHAVGDEALRAVGTRLAACLRTEDTFTRLGGDEFAVVLEGDDTQAEATAGRLRDCLRDPVVIAGRSIRLTASVGVATTADGTSSSDDLLRDADLAMYAAKRRGGDTVDRFTQRMHEEAQERLRLEEDLRAGLGADQVEVHFQPIVALGRGEVHALEALARWRHPTEGLLTPDRFIAVAEVTGLIVALGWEVIRQAAQVATTWPASADGPAPALAVNLSPRQLVEPDVASHLLDLLADVGLPPDRLIVEITETTTLEQVVDAADELARLRDAGVRVALDDFGNGYTSLRYLHGTPVDLLKIDRAFVHGVADSRDQHSLVRTIIELADDLGYSVVAEGVERPEDLAVLTDLDCDLVQGYALARPVAADEVIGVLESLRRRPTPVGAA
jgi:diguanylate cyclase (GGDEF)-like protein